MITISKLEQETSVDDIVFNTNENLSFIENGNLNLYLSESYESLKQHSRSIDSFKKDIRLLHKKAFKIFMDIWYIYYYYFGNINLNNEIFLK